MTSNKLISYRKNYWDNLPKQRGSINDFEKILTLSQINCLDSITLAFKKQSGFEVTIVTIDSNCTSKEKFDDLISHFADSWGISKLSKGNGFIIGFCKGHKRFKIYRDFGSKDILSEEKLQEIINNNFMANFRKRNYYEGLLNGLTELTVFINSKSR